MEPSSLADWINVGLAGVAVAIGAGAFVYAIVQLKDGRKRAREDRANALRDRITRPETLSFIIQGEDVLKECKDAHGEPTLARWDGLRERSDAYREKRAGVIYVLNLLDEMASDCSDGRIDAAQARKHYGALIERIYAEWGWLIDEYQDRGRIKGVPEDDRAWIKLSEKAVLWSDEG